MSKSLTVCDDCWEIQGSPRPGCHRCAEPTLAAVADGLIGVSEITVPGESLYVSVPCVKCGKHSGECDCIQVSITTTHPFRPDEFLLDQPTVHPERTFTREWNYEEALQFTSQFRAWLNRTRQTLCDRKDDCAVCELYEELLAFVQPVVQQ